MVADTRARILAVASELFTEQGYDATSLRQIADRLGFTKAALYYHFPSKEELLVALLEPAEGLIREFMGRLEAATDVASWGAALEWIIEQMFEHLDFFKLVERNRTAVENVAKFAESTRDHREMHQRVERAVRSLATDVGEQVRMVAALGAVTGFDDWAPQLLATAPPDELRAHLVAGVRDLLQLPVG
jgi:AcrR family transcriptional regulator